MKTAPKFYKNLPDNNHCLQASLMIVLNTLNGEVSWEEVDRMTDYESRYYSWTPQAVIVLADKISGTKLLSPMDYRRFVDEGEKYFSELNQDDPEWAEVQKENASPNFKKERLAAKKALEAGLIDKVDNITISQIERLLQGNLLIALLDTGKLENEESAGHFVVVYAQDNNNLILHDPGLPENVAQKVSKISFEKAFMGELIVIPKGEFEFGKDIGLNASCYCSSGKKYKKCHGK